MTTHKMANIPDYFKEVIDHIVELEDYTTQQFELLVLQRLKYCGFDCEEEKVLKLLVDYGAERLDKIIRILRDSIAVMLAQDLF